MYTVQRELKMWQQKADEEAAKALRDAKVKRLEEECAWFRAESLRLDKYADAMKKDLESMREKVNSLGKPPSELKKLDGSVLNGWVLSNFTSCRRRSGMVRKTIKKYYKG